MTRIASLIINGCWIIFVVYWLISAFRQKAVAERKSWLSSLPFRVLFGLGIMLLAFAIWPRPLNKTLTPQTDWVRAIGVVTCVAGLLVTLWSRWTLAGNWSSHVTFKQGHELVRTGPYRFVRHPIYTGILVMILGTTVAMSLLRCWLGLLVMGVGIWIKLKQEEALMLRHFPDEYPAYQKQVKALVPFVI